MEYTFLVCKQNVSSEIKTLMLIPVGLDPSIFCPKVERTRPVSEGMDGKVIYFPPVSAFPFGRCHVLKVPSLIFILTWHVNIYISRQEKVYLVEKEYKKPMIDDVKFRCFAINFE